MALAGVHIVFASAVGMQNGLWGQNVLPYAASASETMASAATSSIRAPGEDVQALLSISSSIPIYYATGPTAAYAAAAVAASHGPKRYMDPSFGREDVIVNSGDYFSWVTA